MVRQQFYEESEAQAVLRRASEIQIGDSGQLSRDELVRAAGEMGISEEALARAEAERSEMQERDEYKRERRKDFHSHLVPYLIINGFLLLLNLVTSPKHLWFIYPALGWGIGLATHAFTHFSGMDESFESWREKRREAAA